jgi:hypothetical protein
MHHLPEYSLEQAPDRIAIARSGDYLTIDIQPQRWGWEANHQLFRLAALGTLALCGWIVASLLHYGTNQFNQGLHLEGIAVVVTAIAFVLLLWVAAEAWLVEATERVHLEITPDQFQIRWQCRSLRGKHSQTRQGKTSDIRAIDLSTRHMALNLFCNRCPYRVFRYFPFLTSCAIWTGDRAYEFGYYLAPAEQKWLTEEIQRFLQQLH